MKVNLIINPKGSVMFKKTLVTMSLIGALAGCQTTDTQESVQALQCFYPDAPKEEAPQWICGVAPAGVEISATGYTKKNVAGMTAMRPMSLNDARVNLSRMFETSVDSLIKTAMESNVETTETAEGKAANANVTEYFASVTKSLSSVTLNNSRVLMTHTSPAGGLYTLVAMDKATFDLNYNKVLEKAANKDAELWNKFNDKKTAEALDKIIANRNIPK